jgi:putative SOS response-associated peptidase YedK
MCSNYRPVTRADRMLAFFGVERGRDEPSADVFPSGLAPMIRLAHDDGRVASGRLALADAIFRFVPDFIAKVEWARRTYNARSETVATKSTYKEAWAKGQRCIIPTESFYEPNYESGKAVRWIIQQPGEVPMGIAGIFRMWRTPDGRDVFTMAMLTVNADDHPLMKRFHKPGDEKRMVVILEPADYSRWLSCRVEEAPAFIKQWHGPLDANAAPLPPRAPKSSSIRTSAPPPPPQSGELF